jgi:hypothetical protein
MLHCVAIGLKWRYSQFVVADREEFEVCSKASVRYWFL